MRKFFGFISVNLFVIWEVGFSGLEGGGIFVRGRYSEVSFDMNCLLGVEDVYWLGVIIVFIFLVVVINS